jgi:hypothetical protein
MPPSDAIFAITNNLAPQQEITFPIDLATTPDYS